MALTYDVLMVSYDGFLIGFAVNSGIVSVARPVGIRI